MKGFHERGVLLRGGAKKKPTLLPASQQAGGTHPTGMHSCLNLYMHIFMTYTEVA